MDISELAVWSALAGGLLTLSGLALVFALLVRGANAVRYLLFVSLTGISSLVRTGLVEALLPGVPVDLMELLKVCAGPLSAALVIRYMAIWLGGVDVDPDVFRVAHWGSFAMLMVAVTLGVLVYVVPDDQYYRLLRASAIATAIAALVGLAASVRAAMLGDPLAGWAAAAAAFLCLALVGMYLRVVHFAQFGSGTWILTALSLMTYFLLASLVAVQRIREAARLDRLAAQEPRTDRATGLPTGSVLVSEVEHAFWRTSRMGGECTVVCLYLHNLYELSDTAGQVVEQQIMTAMAARIRRAAGFRCVVGLYHPRCFVVVISATRRQQYVGTTITRMRAMAAQVLTVTGTEGVQRDFRPRIGVGVVKPHTTRDRPLDVINEAERLALGQQGEFVDEEPPTHPGARLADTAPAPL